MADLHRRRRRAVWRRSRGLPEDLLVYVENAGEFPIPWDAVQAVHAKKVIIECGKLDRRLRDAIGHAHDAEDPNA